jgi:hypothetical protein
MSVHLTRKLENAAVLPKQPIANLLAGLLGDLALKTGN